MSRLWTTEDIARGFKYGYTYLDGDTYEDDKTADEIFRDWLNSVIEVAWRNGNDSGYNQGYSDAGDPDE